MPRVRENDTDHARAALLHACFDALNRGAVESWVACFAEDASSEDMPLGTVWKGRDQLEAGFRQWVAAIPDTHMEVARIFAHDHFAAARWTLSGTLRGALDGIPPELAAAAEGKGFSVRGATLYEFSADGLIQRESLYWNLAEALSQFGLL
ncbi:ester cyclase [Streptomyces sp. OE57]|uniref:ester cyclase n=1 Tax=Streptomyces lacaronensis TaxID=3379885 RepID=UPI0039B72707